MIAEGNIFMLSLLRAQPSLIVQQPPGAVEKGLTCLGQNIRTARLRRIGDWKIWPRAWG
jgi:hypothetical protein